MLRSSKLVLKAMRLPPGHFLSEKKEEESFPADWIQANLETSENCEQDDDDNDEDNSADLVKTAPAQPDHFPLLQGEKIGVVISG